MLTWGFLLLVDGFIACLIFFFSNMADIFAHLKSWGFGGYVGNLDWATLWPVMGLAIKYLAVPGAILCIVAMLVIPQLQYRKNKENYFNLGLDEE